MGLPWWWILLGNHNVCFMKLRPGFAIPSVYIDGWDESAHHWGMKGCKADGNGYIAVTLAISIRLNYTFPQVLVLFMNCFIVLLSHLFIGSSRQHAWELSISFLLQQFWDAGWIERKSKLSQELHGYMRAWICASQFQLNMLTVTLFWIHSFNLFSEDI